MVACGGGQGGDAGGGLPVRAQMRGMQLETPSNHACECNQMHPSQVHGVQELDMRHTITSRPTQVHAGACSTGKRACTCCMHLHAPGCTRMQTHAAPASVVFYAAYTCMPLVVPGCRRMQQLQVWFPMLHAPACPKLYPDADACSTCKCGFLCCMHLMQYKKPCMQVHARCVQHGHLHMHVHIRWPNHVGCAHALGSGSYADGDALANEHSTVTRAAAMQQCVAQRT
eukprot:366103-Chlamydomonas_euryale.AAC.2